MTRRYRQQAGSHKLCPTFLSRHADSRQDYVTVMTLFKPGNLNNYAPAVDS
jgi:hypothetical protein